MSISFRVGLPTVIACATVCSVAVLAYGSSYSRHADYDLVPPPPPTPVLQIPPAPVMLPYSYALDNNGAQSEQLAATTPFAAPPSVTVTHPKPPQPPRPTGMRPANAPNLSVAFARYKGFGMPRLGYSAQNAPGAVEAFPTSEPPPANPWFDASLRWYAQHTSAQQFYSQMIGRPEFGVPNSSYTASAGTIATTYPSDSAPKAVASPTPHHSSASTSKHHFRHSHKVVAGR